MSKTRNEITTDGRAVFYTIMYPKFREAALDKGYTLALHGSMAKDMDLIAVAWVENARPVKELIEAFSDLIGHTVWKDHHLKEGNVKPHGRVTYTLSIFSDWYIDLAVIAPKELHVYKPLSEIDDRDCVEIIKIIIGMNKDTQLHDDMIKIEEILSNLDIPVPNVNLYSWYKAFKYLENRLYKIE